MSKKLNIESGFALLDVTKGRGRLLKVFEPDGPSGLRVPKRLPVTLTGFVNGVWGNDDGVSREFSVEVTKVTLD